MASTQKAKSAVALSSFGGFMKYILLKSHSSRIFFAAGYARAVIMLVME